jgi:hypothetical protein
MSASPHAWNESAWGAHNGQFRVTSGHPGEASLTITVKRARPPKAQIAVHPRD